MANHKRGRPKHQRNGCLLCKPHKDERVAKVGPASVERKLQVRVKDVLDEYEEDDPS